MGRYVSAKVVLTLRKPVLKMVMMVFAPNLLTITEQTLERAAVKVIAVLLATYRTLTTANIMSPSMRRCSSRHHTSLVKVRFPPCHPYPRERDQHPHQVSSHGLGYCPPTVGRGAECTRRHLSQSQPWGGHRLRTPLRLMMMRIQQSPPHQPFV